MIEIISYIFILAVCGFVAVPLFAKKSQIVDQKTDDLLHQKQLIRETIHDLEFDFQTEKLSEQDYKMLIAEREAAIQKADSEIGRTGGLKNKNFLNNLEAEIAIVKDKLQPTTELVCAQCGNKYEKGNKFCSNCGAQL
ncbi:MAG: zinc-ribbon domain-containing protein [Actinobacteria bacterium]|nr:zinc-ribbon domain-containing protein [Actinomycetota bacterium]